jgi:hypothetical protein
VSAPEDPPPPAPAVVEFALHEDQDEIYPTMLGPTLAQLQELAAKGKLTGDDIAGYLALVQAFSETRNIVPVEYLGTRPQQIAGEALSLIAEKLVGLKRWSQMENAKRQAAAEERNKKLCDIANERYPDPKIEPTTIARDFLEDPTRHPDLHDLLQVWDPEQRTWKLMGERTLRGILAERDKHRK